MSTKIINAAKMFQSWRCRIARVANGMRVCWEWPYVPSVDIHPPKTQRHWGFARQCALLLALLVAASLITATIGWLLFATSGAIAAAVAAAVCLLGGLATLWACHLYTGPQRALFAVAAGMFLRTSIPLALALVVRQVAPDVFASGLIYFVLVDYLVCLAAETWLAATQMQDATPKNMTPTSAPLVSTPARLNSAHRAQGIS
jgi:hypothetical protein